MGRGRNKGGAGAVERAIYDIFGNITGYDDQPSAGAAVPAPPPEPLVVTQEVTTPTSDVVSMVPYRETTVFDPSRLSAQQQSLLKASYDYMETLWQNLQNGTGDYNERQYTNRIANYANQMGLDMNKEEDRRIIADLMSVFPFSQKWNPTLAERKALRKQNAKQLRERGMTIPDTGEIEYAIQPSRSVNLYGSVVNLSNNSFFVSPNAPSGIGYLMVARQMAAAREVARRTGKMVEIRVHAVTARGMNGFKTWPKLGYVFQLSYVMQQRLMNMGFSADAVRNTATLMVSKAADGTTGFDAWTKVSPSRGDGWGTTMITPESARGGALGMAERVLQEYGKRRGFLQKQMQKSKNGNNDWLLTTDDDAILRDVWQSFGKKLSA